jgi:hypothetical protein
MSARQLTTGIAPRSARAAVWLGVTLVVQLGTAGSSLAQSTPENQGPRPGTRAEGMHREGGGRRMFSRGVLEGPPAPEVLRDSVGLSGAQLQAYSRRYAAYAAETGPARDSLRASIQAMRAAFHSGDRSGARSRRDTLSRQAKDLSQRDQEFEKALKAGLSKEQQNRFDKWQESREEARRARHKHGRRAPQGGNL